MRISGGQLRGRHVPSPANQQTRPTTERIREALFSMLAGHIGEAHVLDLFAGCGLLGLESLSRGAALACFVEQHPATCQRLRQIIVDFQLSPQADVVAGSVTLPTLQRIKTQATLKMGWDVAFNLVFLDPPYGKGLALGTLAMLSESGILAPRAIAAVEHEALVEPAAIFSPPWRLWKSRRHGSTAITLLTLGGGEGVSSTTFPGIDEITS